MLLKQKSAVYNVKHSTSIWCNCPMQVVQEVIPLPDTGIYLMYHSSRSAGYMSTLFIQLTPDQLPHGLVMVHLRINVEGFLFEKTFEAEPNLKYKFAWDRRNAYGQKSFGIVNALGKTKLFI